MDQALEDDRWSDTTANSSGSDSEEGEEGNEWLDMKMMDTHKGMRGSLAMEKLVSSC